MKHYANTVNNQAHYATDEELDWMNRTAKTLDPDDMVVMLGAGPGVLLLALKDAVPETKAFVVDHTRVEYVFAYLNDAGYNTNVSYVVKDAAEAGAEWKRGEVALLIVDDDHSEKGVRASTKAWLPHVKEGGLIFFHDYDADGTWFADQERYPGVKKAVDDLMKEYQFVERVGTAVVYRKVPKGTVPEEPKAWKAKEDDVLFTPSPAFEEAVEAARLPRGRKPSK